MTKPIESKSTAKQKSQNRKQRVSDISLSNYTSDVLITDWPFRVNKVIYLFIYLCDLPNMISVHHVGSVLDFMISDFQF